MAAGLHGSLVVCLWLQLLVVYYWQVPAHLSPNTSHVRYNHVRVIAKQDQKPTKRPQERSRASVIEVKQ